MQALALLRGGGGCEVKEGRRAPAHSKVGLRWDRSFRCPLTRSSRAARERSRESAALEDHDGREWQGRSWSHDKQEQWSKKRAGGQDESGAVSGSVVELLLPAAGRGRWLVHPLMRYGSRETGKTE